jgi:hypothetical protein
METPIRKQVENCVRLRSKLVALGGKIFHRGMAAVWLAILLVGLSGGGMAQSPSAFVRMS